MMATEHKAASDKQRKGFPAHRSYITTAKSQTCNDVPNWFYKGVEGRNFRLPVFPHRLPNNKATSQPKCQVRLLERQTDVVSHKFTQKSVVSSLKGLPFLLCTDLTRNE